MRVNLDNLRKPINAEDSEFVELANGEFVNRDEVHYLLDGDVITFFDGLSLELYNNIFFEVEPLIEEMTVNPKWKRTGASYTMEEMNEKYSY